MYLDRFPLFRARPMVPGFDSLDSLRTKASTHEDRFSPGYPHRRLARLWSGGALLGRGLANSLLELLPGPGGSTTIAGDSRVDRFLQENPDRRLHAPLVVYSSRFSDRPAPAGESGYGKTRTLCSRIVHEQLMHVGHTTTTRTAGPTHARSLHGNTLANSHVVCQTPCQGHAAPRRGISGRGLRHRGPLDRRRHGP